MQLLATSLTGVVRLAVASELSVRNHPTHRGILEAVDCNSFQQHGISIWYGKTSSGRLARILDMARLSAKRDVSDVRSVRARFSFAFADL